MNFNFQETNKSQTDKLREEAIRNFRDVAGLGAHDIAMHWAKEAIPAPVEVDRRQVETSPAIHDTAIGKAAIQQEEQASLPLESPYPSAADLADQARKDLEMIHREQSDQALPPSFEVRI